VQGHPGTPTPLRVRIDENLNTVLLFGQENGGNGLAPTNDSNSSSAPPIHSHVAEGALEGFDELIAPRLRPRPSRRADRRQPTGILRYSVSATDVRSIRDDLEDGRSISAEPGVPTPVRDSLAVVFDRIDYKLPSAANDFGAAKRPAKVNGAEQPAPRSTLAEATNRPTGQRRGNTTAPPTRQSRRLANH
jgi:hypothetical protein